MLKAYSGILSKSDSSILPKLPKYQDQESLATRTRTLPPSKNSNWFLNPKHSKQPGDVGTSSNITQFPKVVQPKDHVPTAFALPQTQRNHPKGWGETYASTTLPGGQHAVKCSWPVADLAKVADYLAKLNLSSKLIFYIFFVLNRVILNMVYLQLLSLGWTTCFRNMLTCKPGSGRRWRVTSQPFGISLTCHMPRKLAISLVRPHASCIEIRFTHTFKSCSWHNLWAENAWKRVLIKQDQIKSCHSSCLYIFVSNTRAFHSNDLFYATAILEGRLSSFLLYAREFPGECIGFKSSCDISGQVPTRSQYE